MCGSEELNIVEVVSAAFFLCTCSLALSLYHSMLGGGSLSARHSNVRCPLTGTVTAFTSPEPSSVGGTETQT